MNQIFKLFSALLLFTMFSGQTFGQCVGSTVSLPEGGVTAYTCPQDGNADVVNFSNSLGTNENYAYAITDSDNNILAITTESSFDFDPAPAGTCLVWGFSYSGNITAEPGELVFTTQFSDGCWLISQNAISVVREQPEGGMVQTPQGQTDVYICLQEGLSGFVGFQTNSTSSANYAFVITDDENNILALPGQNFVDFSGAGVGVCRVWGLSYTGNLLAQLGDNAAETVLSDNCFDLSDNYIRVDRNEVDGGTVSTPEGENFVNLNCTQDGNPDIVNLAHVSSSSAPYAYAITDEANVILAITTETSFDFDPAPTGTCRVWGFSYTGEITAQPGELVFSTAFSSGCWLISSNAINVIRQSGEGVDGGTVSMPSGATERYTCPGDGVADVVSFVTTSTAENFVYVITDDQNNILGIPPGNSQDFEGAGVGVCRVWGLAFTGNITAQAGDNAAAVALSDGCFDLSDNFITVNRDNPDGATVSMPSGATERYTCPGDGVPDVVSFVNTSTSNTQYAYVITDDQNIILGLPGTDSQDFEGAGVGVCRVWGLAYTGTITAQVGDDAAAVALTDDCFDLSDNFITVNRDNPDGATVSMPSGATERYTCPGDGVADVVSFVNTSTSNTQYAYVITDDQNIILGLPGTDSQDFEGAGVGVCRVWGLAYTGTITAQVGDDAAAVALTDDCFDLSDNFITVNRDNPDGATVSMPSGATERYTCPGDGVADVVSFVNTSTSNTQYAYVITDDQNIILGLPGTDSQDFEGAGVGVCRVWGLAYTGTITAQVGDDAAAVALTDDCFDLSDNFITVNRDNPDGGTVATTDGETVVTITAGDGNPDEIFFQSEGTSNSNFTYVITDDQNIILGIPPSNSQDFEGAGVGVCRVWGLSYTGAITAQAGDDAAAVALSDDCFDLSDNFIEVNRVGGIGNLEAPSVLLRPNPVRSELSIELNFDESLRANSDITIAIVSFTGEVLSVERAAAFAGENVFQINTSNLKNGYYQVKIQGGNWETTQSFVKIQE